VDFSSTLKSTTGDIMIYLSVYDTETTGLNANEDDICQFACVVHAADADKEDTLSFETLCNPGVSITPDSQKIHGISDAMVKDSPSAKSIIQDWMGELIALADGDPIILCGHNTGFDFNFIRKHVDIPDNVKQLCTMRLARRMEPLATNHKLEYLYREHYKLNSDRTVKAHDALCDVWMCFELIHNWFDETPDYVAIADALTSPTKLLVMPFGKHKGTLFSDLPWYYIKWLAQQDDTMDMDVRFTARQYAS
jgi:DNA polymerase-3 subunit epsilon